MQNNPHPNLQRNNPAWYNWCQQMRNAGYDDKHIQMYFHQQMAQQQQQQQAEMQTQHAQQTQQSSNHRNSHPTQGQASQHADPQMQTNPNQPQNGQYAYQQNERQKLQMAHNIVNAYQGRVTLQRVMQMEFVRVKDIHEEIVRRLQHPNQRNQRQHPRQQNCGNAAHQQQQQQAQQQQYGQNFASNANASSSACTYSQSSQHALSQTQSRGINAAMAVQQTQHPNSAHAQNNGHQGLRPQAPQVARCQNGNASPVLFDNENPIDIVFMLLHQYPQVKTWLQSMEYHGTVTASKTHAVQFLTSLMDSQPQFRKVIKLIQQRLKQLRAAGETQPSQAATDGLLPQHFAMANTMNKGAMNADMHSQNLRQQQYQQQKSQHVAQASGQHSGDGLRYSDASLLRKKRKKRKTSKRPRNQRLGKKSSKKKKKQRYSEDEDYNGHDTIAWDDDEDSFNPSSSKIKEMTSASRYSSEPEYSGPETDDDLDGHSDSQIVDKDDESDNYKPGVPVGNVGSRKSYRKRRDKKRSLSNSYNGDSYTTSKAKRRKTSHQRLGGSTRTSPKSSNFSQYISPAPVHWKIVQCSDPNEHETNEQLKGRFKIKIKQEANPLKEALLRIGGNRNFTLDDVLDQLCEIEDNDDIQRTKPAKQRLKEELMAIRGCWFYSGVPDESDTHTCKDMESDFDDGLDAEEFNEFNCAAFVKLQQYTNDNSDDMCYRCGKYGELIICDGCPHVFHLSCVGLQKVPAGDWFCVDCVECRKDENHNNLTSGDSNNYAHSHNRTRQVVQTEEAASTQEEPKNEQAAQEANDGDVEIQENVNRYSCSDMFTKFFLAKTVEDKISDVAQITALNKEGNGKQNESDNQVEAVNEAHNDFPEPNIDVTDDMENDNGMNENQVQADPEQTEQAPHDDQAQQPMPVDELQEEFPSPDAPDSGLDSCSKFDVEDNEPQQKTPPKTEDRESEGMQPPYHPKEAAAAPLGEVPVAYVAKPPMEAPPQQDPEQQEMQKPPKVPSQERIEEKAQQPHPAQDALPETFENTKCEQPQVQEETVDVQNVRSQPGLTEEAVPQQPTMPYSDVEYKNEEQVNVDEVAAEKEAADEEEDSQEKEQETPETDLIDYDKDGNIDTDNTENKSSETHEAEEEHKESKMHQVIEISRTELLDTENGDNNYKDEDQDVDMLLTRSQEF